MIKLFDIPEGSKVRLSLFNGETEETTIEVCTFGHIDGMYSYITTPNGSIVHLAATTPMKLGDDGIYEME